MPQRQVLAQAPLALCNPAEVGALPPSVLVAQVQLRQVAGHHRDHKASLAFLGNGDHFAIRICKQTQHGGVAVIYSCSQELAMPCFLGAGGWHGHGHWGNVAACHSGDKGVLSPGRRVSGHLWSRCESLQERSSGSPSWLCGFSSRLQHVPQRRSSGSASAASSANSNSIPISGKKQE